MTQHPDFTKVPFVRPEIDRGTATGPAWTTPEGIDVAPVYTSADMSGLGHLDGFPGIAPYLRGPYPTMYVTQPWTIRQYAGFLDRGRIERVLPPQYCCRPEGPFGCLRSRHPPRL